MQRNMKIKIGGAIGAIALAVAAPVALAQTDQADEAEAAPETGDLICFEVDAPFVGEFGFEGDWLDDGEWSDDAIWLDGLDGELPPLPDELLAALNQEAVELAAHLDAAGIAYEVVDGPMGESWVEWDFDDDAANAAVEEFFEGREDPFELIIDAIEFDDGELMVEGPGFFMVEGPEFLEFGDAAFGGEICIEAPDAQAATFTVEMQALTDALAEAGVAFTTETVQVNVPVWDYEDDAARQVVEEFYTGLHGGFAEGWFEDVEVVGTGS